MRLLVAALALSPGFPPGLQESPTVRIRDWSGSCYHHEEATYEWVLEGDRWVLGEWSLSRTELESIRAIVLASKAELTDELAQVGIDEQSITEHRSQILELALRGHCAEYPVPAELPADLEQLLSYDHLAPPIQAELTGYFGLNSFLWSTSGVGFEATLPGTPVVRVSAAGETPYLLPWTVQVGDREWQTPSLNVARTMLRLANPDGPSAALIDGSRYWSEDVWNDESFWSRIVGDRLDEELSRRACARLPGYQVVTERFEIENVTTGFINMQPLSLFVGLRSREPSPIEEVRWHNLLQAGAPTSDWLDFQQAYADAVTEVQKRPWLLEWKSAGPSRTIGIDLAGARGLAEHSAETFVEPPWRLAGFAGRPEFELLLRRERRWCATIYLGSEEPGALITRATPGGKHWLDQIDVSYHPKSPDYAVVDARGQCTVRGKD